MRCLTVSHLTSTSPYLYPLQEGEKDRPLYADGYPYLLVSQPSLAGLNTVLEEAGVELTVEQTRFRPNITVGGSFQPFSEDRWVSVSVSEDSLVLSCFSRWVHVKIGDSTIFRNVKLCTRCNYTTIDPATGRNTSNEDTDLTVFCVGRRETR